MVAITITQNIRGKHIATEDCLDVLTVTEDICESISGVICQCWVVSHSIYVEFVWFASHVHQLDYIYFISDADLVQQH